jgi:hypothetical protein
MKKHSFIPAALCLLVAGSAACSSNSSTGQTSEPEHAGIAEQRQIGIAPVGVAIWPAGPIVFDGTAAIMPLAIFTPVPLGMLAFDIPGVTGLTITAGAFGADGAFVATPGITSAAISAPFFGAISAGLAPPIAPLAFSAPALVPAAAIAPPLLTPIGTTTFLTPFISQSALMFSSVAATAALTPLIVNVGFVWPGSLNFSAINVFAASADATTAFLASSTTAAATTAAVNTAAINNLAFTNMLFPLTFTPAMGTLPATLFW